MPARRPQQLYEAVGHVVVASGHCEFAMARLLLAFDGLMPQDFAQVSVLGWASLVRELRLREERAPGVQDALDWADSKNLEQVRNNAVHSVWDLTPQEEHARGGRRYRVSKSEIRQAVQRGQRPGAPATVIGSLALLHQGAESLFSFAEQLSAATPGPLWGNPPVPWRPWLLG